MIIIIIIIIVETGSGGAGARPFETERPRRRGRGLAPHRQPHSAAKAGRTAMSGSSTEQSAPPHTSSHDY